MKYDVIISSYNGQCYIREQIESISNQIPPPEKIIIRDDGSTDLTISEINSFIDDNKLHSKIIVKSGKNLGYIKSFEALLSSCTEEVVFFSDQDDVWLPGKAKLILDALKEPSVNLVFTNAHVTDSKLEIKNELVNSSKAKYGLYDLLHTNIVTGATVAAKVNFIKNNCLPFLDSVPHDFQMACKSAQLNSLKFINEHTILYRQHENNQIGASKKNLISRICRNFTYSAYLRRKKELSYRKILINNLNISELDHYELKALKFKCDVYSNDTITLINLFLILKNFRFFKLSDLLVFSDFILSNLNKHKVKTLK